MKVSVVITVLNEEESILPLLLSLHRQTFSPLEIVVVDGGSIDKTVEKIKKFSSKFRKVSIHLIEESGNISHGRNVGIRNAKASIIALTDAGCIAKNDWLERLAEPFKDKEVGMVAGFYEMKAKTPFEKAVAPFCGISRRRFDQRNYMPSARSMAFRRNTWKEVGGFSEGLVQAGEDTLFNYRILKKGIKIVRVPMAVVVWQAPGTFSQIIGKFYSYAKGDAEANIWWHPAQGLRTHNIKIVSIFVRYIVFAFLFFGGFTNQFLLFAFIFALLSYLFWSIWKLYEDIDDIKALFLVPVVQIVSDLSVMAGFLKGIFSKFTLY